MKDEVETLKFPNKSLKNVTINSLASKILTVILINTPASETLITTTSNLYSQRYTNET